MTSLLGSECKSGDVSESNCRCDRTVQCVQTLVHTTGSSDSGVFSAQLTGPEHISQPVTHWERRQH